MSSRKAFKLLASLKLAIPLLVVTVVATIIGSLFPDPGIFRTWWYLSLLGTLGLSLAAITILHVPTLRRRKGRNAMIGVVSVHFGILILIAGAMYGGISGVRHNFKAIEGEITILPGLPFVLELESLTIEEYPAETFAHMDLELIPKKRQDSRLILHRNGQPVAEVIAAPGRPAQFERYKILPSLVDIGWYFELIVTDRRSREKTIPVRPWEPPLFSAGGQQLMAHRSGEGDTMQVQVFTLEEGQPKLLGEVGDGRELALDSDRIRLGGFRRYTGMAVYDRPHMPVLVAGVLLTLAGLVWHFFHRYRD